MLYLIRNEKYQKLNAEDKSWYTNYYIRWMQAKRKVEEFEMQAKVVRYLEHGISLDAPLTGEEPMHREYDASKSHLERCENKLSEELEYMGC